MRKLYALIRVNLSSAMIDRADMFIYTLSNWASPFIIMLVWLSFPVDGKDSIYSRTDLIWYFILIMVIKQATSAWGGQFLSARIKRGAISPFLTQPSPYIFHYISNNLAEKVMKLLISVPLVLLMVFFLKVTVPSVPTVLLFVSILSVIGAGILAFSLDIFIGLLSFWFDETSAIGDTYGVLISLFSGVFIPIVALPSAIRTIGIFLPFRYTLSLPAEIFLGQLTSQEVLQSLGIQMLWVLFMILTCRLLWKRGLKTYSSNGA